MRSIEMTSSTVKRLWDSLKLPQDILQDLKLTGDPLTVLPSSFNLGVAAQASVAASGLSAACFHFLKTGERQNVTVNARHAALEFHSEAYYSVGGKVPAGIWDDIAGTYPTKDGSYVRIHTNYPHHRRGILSILGLPSTPSRNSVAQALSTWDSKQFEDEAARKKMCAAAMRSTEEWHHHPHFQATKDIPPVQLIKVGEAPKRVISKTGSTPRALEGTRVLDLTHVIAGPVCARTLAAHGADVLHITSPNMPSLPHLDADTLRGKRTTQLDLTTATDCEKLWVLAQEADVFLQGYRPGGLAAKGFDVAELARVRPGIICANLRAWGWDGPWKDRRGFDSLVQTATGFNFDEALAFASFVGKVEILENSVVPKPLPVQAIDHAAGYLLACGVAAALSKTITYLLETHSEGGSWEVRVSLASVGNWIRSLGRLGLDGFKNAVPLPAKAYPPAEEIATLSKELRVRGYSQNDCNENVRAKDGMELDTAMLALKHSAILEKTPADVMEAPMKLNLDTPSWLPQS